MPASSRSVSRAPRPHGNESDGRPASSRACQTRSADCGRDENLETVLAGVTGPRDRRAHVGDLPVREPVVLDLVEVDAGQRLQDFERRRALDGEQCVARAGVDGDRVAGRRVCASRSTRSPSSMLPALTTSRKCCGASRYTSRSSTKVPSASAGRNTAPARPAASTRRSTRCAARPPARPCRRSRSRPCG